ncbi:Protein YobA [Paraconexibacter sp. AEG42_29]|uniref:Protein YobA n=1 Tax=Paraconexibacter sp. AEG42_29 TaxID=2997339 RepID=A0AAU7APJ8_9ACTN
MRRLMPAVTALVAAGAVAAAPALAHVDLERTSPGKGKTAKTSTRSVTVSFSGSFVTGKLTVTGPGGKVVGRGGQDPRKTSRLRAELRSGLKPGTYKATWRILDQDGHRQNGTFTFKLRR